MGLFYFIFVCYGFTMLIVQSRIMKPFREFFKEPNPMIYKLLNCMMCVGFWVGLIVSFTVNYSPDFIGLVERFSSHFFDAAFISGTVWLIYLIQLNLERHVKDQL